jgi:predicted flap endonuclease-1-like 5' DNA nuclease
MIPFWAETAILMVVAYFLGAALGCFSRKSLAPVARPVATGGAERRVDPLPEAVTRNAEAARPAPRPEPARPAPVAPASPAVAAPASRPAEGPQDLRSVRGIDAATEAKLIGLGIRRFEQIAAWGRADVDRIAQALGQKGRIARENWIEQAQILAKGGQTLFSVRRARGEASTAAPTPDEGVSAPPPTEVSLPRAMSRAGVAALVVAPPVQPAPAAAAPAAAPQVSERAAFAQQPAVPIRPGEPPAHDNLKRIGGITSEIEQRLNTLGVARYSEIAQWSPGAVERIDRELGTAGRISRENWIEQAQILSRGGDTRFSREFDRQGQAPAGPAPRPIKLPDAIREHEAATSAGTGRVAGRTDLSALRSVRSEAYQHTSEPGPEAARRAASRRVVRAGQADDLKRIKGIAFQIEKQLNALGVTTYEDIANWTSDDIEHISKSLDFKGRIQRENWVEQARILAAGGDTEFSRRADRREG